MSKDYGLNSFGRVIKSLKMATFWKDGDSCSFHWNYWNPLTLLVLPFFIILTVIFEGIPEFLEFSYSYGFGYSEYWKERLSEREFI